MRAKKFATSSKIFFKKFFSSDNQILDTKWPFIVKIIFFECLPSLQANSLAITRI